MDKSITSEIDESERGDVLVANDTEALTTAVEEQKNSPLSPEQ